MILEIHSIGELTAGFTAMSFLQQNYLVGRGIHRVKSQHKTKC